MFAMITDVTQSGNLDYYRWFWPSPMRTMSRRDIRPQATERGLQSIATSVPA